MKILLFIPLLVYSYRHRHHHHLHSSPVKSIVKNSVEKGEDESTISTKSVNNKEKSEDENVNELKEQIDILRKQVTAYQSNVDPVDYLNKQSQNIQDYQDITGVEGIRHRATEILVKSMTHGLLEANKTAYYQLAKTAQDISIETAKSIANASSTQIVEKCIEFTIRRVSESLCTSLMEKSAESTRIAILSILKNSSMENESIDTTIETAMIKVKTGGKSLCLDKIYKFANESGFREKLKKTALSAVEQVAVSIAINEAKKRIDEKLVHLISSQFKSPNFIEGMKNRIDKGVNQTIQDFIKMEPSLYKSIKTKLNDPIQLKRKAILNEKLYQYSLKLPMRISAEIIGGIAEKEAGEALSDGASTGEYLKRVVEKFK